MRMIKLLLESICDCYSGKGGRVSQIYTAQKSPYPHSNHHATHLCGCGGHARLPGHKHLPKHYIGFIPVFHRCVTWKSGLSTTKHSTKHARWI